jgi:hypothetical protein
VHFTVLFDLQDRLDLSFGRLFKPCPTWMSGDVDIFRSKLTARVCHHRRSHT